MKRAYSVGLGDRFGFSYWGIIVLAGLVVESADNGMAESLSGYVSETIFSELGSIKNVNVCDSADDVERAFFSVSTLKGVEETGRILQLANIALKSGRLTRTQRSPTSSHINFVAFHVHILRPGGIFTIEDIPSDKRDEMASRSLTTVFDDHVKLPVCRISNFFILTKHEAHIRSELSACCGPTEAPLKPINEGVNCSNDNEPKGKISYPFVRRFLWLGVIGYLVGNGLVMLGTGVIRRRRIAVIAMIVGAVMMLVAGKIVIGIIR